MSLKTNEDACTEKFSDNVFNYDLTQAPRGQKVQLLNIGGSDMYGTITNLEIARQMGIIAWYPVPKRDKVKEVELGYLMPPRTASPPKQDKIAQRLRANIQETAKAAKVCKLNANFSLAIAVCLVVFPFLVWLLTKYTFVLYVLSISVVAAGFFLIIASACRSKARELTSHLEYEEELHAQYMNDVPEGEHYRKRSP